MPETPIAEVKARHEGDLLALPNVVGVGVGEREGKPVIKVFVTQKAPESTLGADERVPVSLEGYEVDVEEIGVIQAQTTEEAR